MALYSFTFACIGVDVIAISTESAFFCDVFGIAPCVANDGLTQCVCRWTYFSLAREATTVSSTRRLVNISMLECRTVPYGSNTSATPRLRLNGLINPIVLYRLT